MRFLHAEPPVTQRPLSQQSRRDFHRRDGNRGRLGGRLWHGGSRWGLRWRWLARPVRHPVWPQYSLSQQWQRDVHGRDGKGRLAPPGWASSAVWFVYDNDG